MAGKSEGLQDLKLEGNHQRRFLHTLIEFKLQFSTYFLPAGIFT